jgi:TRAP-type C4-dicarboxylate transport system substrate-binding protein
MMKKSIFIGAIILFFVPLFSQANTRITLNCFFPPQNAVCTKILPTWAKKVKSVTDGRVQVFQYSKSMAPPPDQLNSVRSGVFDAALQFNGFIRKQVPVARVSMMPFTVKLDSEANSVALWQTYKKFGSDAGELKGVKLLGFLVSPGTEIYSLTDTPITSVKDLKDRKMWALPGVTATVLKNIGSPVVSGPAVQMTQLIQNGVVDGAAGLSAKGAAALQVVPSMKSVTRTNRSLFTASFTFFISDKKWKAISPKDRKKIMSISGETFAKVGGKIWNEEEREALKNENKNLKVVHAGHKFEEKLAEAAQPVVAKWVKEVSKKGVDGRAELKFFKKKVKELTSSEFTGSAEDGRSQ